MRDIVVFAVVAAFLISALFSRFMGLVGYWWFGIFRPHDWAWSELIASLRLPLLSALILVIPCAMQGIFPSMRGAIPKLIFTFLILVLVGKITSSCTPIGMFRQDMWLQFSILCYVVLLTVRLTDTPKRFFWIVAIVGLSLAFHAGKAGISSIIGSGGTYYGASTMSGPFSGSNGFAFGSAILLFFNIFLLNLCYTGDFFKFIPYRYDTSFIRFGVKTVFWILLVGIAYNVISLFSRGSFLAMCGGICLWLMLNKKLKVGYILISIPLLFLAIQVAPLPEGFKERIDSVFVEEDKGEQLDRSAASRPHFWNVAYLIAKDYPFGIGPGCYNTMYPFYDSTNGFYGKYRTVHSSHFQVVSEAGFFGTIVWLLLYIVSLKQLFTIRKIAFKRPSQEDDRQFFFLAANMLITCQAVFFVGGAFYAQAYNDVIWLIWGLSASLSIIFTQQLNQKSTQNAN